MFGIGLFELLLMVLLFIGLGVLLRSLLRR